MIYKIKWFDNFSLSQLTGNAKKPFTDTLKSLFLKTKSWCLVDAQDKGLIQNCINSIVNCQLSANEYGYIQTTFLDDFHRWRELVLKASQMIVEKYRMLLNR